jgi:hypothetical protein
LRWLIAAVAMAVLVYALVRLVQPMNSAAALLVNAPTRVPDSNQGSDQQIKEKTINHSHARSSKSLTLAHWEPALALRNEATRGLLVAGGILERPITESITFLRQRRRFDLLREFNLDAAFVACTKARQWVEQGVEPLSTESIRRPPSFATVRYLQAHCEPLWNDFDSLRDMQRVIDDELQVQSQTELPSFEALASSQIKPFKAGQYSLMEVRDGLRADQPFDIRAELATYALKSNVGLAGVDWDAFRHTMPDTRIAMFGLLLAAKFGCGEPGACAPGSPMLIVLCASPEAGIYCQIPADLSQIARDSLTAREFALWQTIEPESI